ncbi:hypothetical protein HU200_025054 [Digitaria exilis]|uniref:Uncharacterized protein n=1 Tax=Digitaria exilis TaxID=1010633 RepID=A0A835C0E6_9POAL|nr:hypothetical protein HU200_025054 [Digitaria exilis]
MRCGLVTPSPALYAAASSMTVRPLSTLTTILPFGQRAPSFPRLEAGAAIGREGCPSPAHGDAISTSATVCSLVARAVVMASQLVDSASLTASSMSHEISADTVHRTLQVYVDVFVLTDEDSYNRRFSKDNVLWFLDALRGLGSISHILLENALEALSHTHPKRVI